jgi:hypothetical protein
MTYTPFLSNIGKTLGGAIEQRGKNELIQSAYMGKPGAMQQLMSVDPQAAQQIERGKVQEEQRGMQQQKSVASEEDRKRKILSENKELVDSTLKEVANLETFEEANTYINSVVERNQELFQGLDMSLTPEAFEQIKKTQGTKETAQPFAGTGMEAQVSNILTKGVSDPQFRKSPEYARAYQIATEPKVIKTPTGDILLPPNLPGIFKSPEEEEMPEEDQIKEITNKVQSDAEAEKPKYIPGTERDKKFTEGEKKAAGFYERMKAGEGNIDKLGDFDPTDPKEVALGLSNITATPQMQLHRQSADDWIRAKLRMESGAVIATDEMASEYKTYFPRIGDSPAVIEQKKKSREIAMESMRKNAGNLIKEEEKRKEKTSPAKPSSLSIEYEGKQYTFPDQKSLDEYKKAAGL